MFRLIRPANDLMPVLAYQFDLWFRMSVPFRLIVNVNWHFCFRADECTGKSMALLPRRKKRLLWVKGCAQLLLLWDSSANTCVPDHKTPKNAWSQFAVSVLKPEKPPIELAPYSRCGFSCFLVCCHKPRFILQPIWFLNTFVNLIIPYTSICE